MEPYTLKKKIIIINIFEIHDQLPPTPTNFQSMLHLTSYHMFYY